MRKTLVYKPEIRIYAARCPLPISRIFCPKTEQLYFGSAKTQNLPPRHTPASSTEGLHASAPEWITTSRRIRSTRKGMTRQLQGQNHSLKENRCPHFWRKNTVKTVLTEDKCSMSPFTDRFGCGVWFGNVEGPSFLWEILIGRKQNSGFLCQKKTPATHPLCSNTEQLLPAPKSSCPHSPFLSLPCRPFLCTLWDRTCVLIEDFTLECVPQLILEPCMFSAEIPKAELLGGRNWCLNFLMSDFCCPKKFWGLVSLWILMVFLPIVELKIEICSEPCNFSQETLRSQPHPSLG